MVHEFRFGKLGIIKELIPLMLFLVETLQSAFLRLEPKAKSFQDFISCKKSCFCKKYKKITFNG